MPKTEAPRLDADGLPDEFRLSAAVLRDRIEEDPHQAQRFLSHLVQKPSPSESDYALLAHEVGQQGTDAIRTYRTIILSGLLRWLSYDHKTLESIESDPDYLQLRASRQPNMSEKQLEAHKVKIGATELYHFAGQVALFTSTPEEIPEQPAAKVIDFNKSA